METGEAFDENEASIPVRLSRTASEGKIKETLEVLDGKSESLIEVGEQIRLF